jgi:hypothetical protein
MAKRLRMSYSTVTRWIIESDHQSKRETHREIDLNSRSLFLKKSKSPNKKPVSHLRRKNRD